MRNSFREFLSERLAAFQSGDLWDATRDILMPAPVYRGDEVHVYETQGKYVDWLTGCYRELKDLGWTRTDLDLREVDETKNGGIRALVRWTSRASGGDIVTICDIAYFCSYTSREGWKISMTEVIAKWGPGGDDAALPSGAL